MGLCCGARHTKVSPTGLRSVHVYALLYCRDDGTASFAVKPKNK